MLEVPQSGGNRLPGAKTARAAAPHGAQTLAKGLRLLGAIAASDTKGARLSTLAERLGFELPTAHRLLRCLVEEGFLHKDSSNRYHLGAQLFDLGLLAAHRYDLGASAFMPLHALAESHGETAFLTRRTGLDMVCIERVDGSYAIAGLSMTVGTRRPIGLGASGVALLAGMDPGEVEAILVANDARYRAYYGEGIGAILRHRVKAARRSGYAVANGLRTSGSIGIGVPVPCPGSLTILSLSIVAGKARITPKRQSQLVLALQTTAAEISARIDRSP